MTKQQLTLSEIDALVATKVMGWKYSEAFAAWHPDRKDATLADSVSKLKWKPTTDISQAWEVVEKLQSEEKIITMEPLFSMRWAITVCIEENGKHANIIEDSFKIAICLAALATVGIDAEVKE